MGTLENLDLQSATPPVTSERRTELRNLFEDKAARAMVDAMPAIEELILNSPNQSQAEFAENVRSVADQNNLNGLQREMVLETYRKVQNDIQGLKEYVGLISGQEPTGLDNPPKAVNENDEIKKKFLTDLGVDEEDLEEALKLFSLDEDFPMALVVHYDGNATQLADTLGVADYAKGSAHFIHRLNFEDGPEGNKKADLLSGRIIVVTHPDVAEQRNTLTTPEQSQKHEKRHYVYRLLKDGRDINNFDNFVEDSVLDEIQAEIASGIRRVGLDVLLSGSFPEGDETKQIILREHPEVSGKMVDLLASINKSFNSPGISELTISNTIITSNSLAEAMRRIDKLASGNDVDWKAVLTSATGLNSGSVDRVIFDNNLYFAELVTARAVRYYLDKNDVAGLDTYANALANLLKSHAIYGISSSSGSFEQSSEVFEFITKERELLIQNGVKNEQLNVVYSDAQQMIEKSRVERIRRNSWEDFLGFLAATNSGLRGQYDQLATGRSFLAQSKLKQFVMDDIHPIYQQWIKDKEIQYLK